MQKPATYEGLELPLGACTISAMEGGKALKLIQQGNQLYHWKTSLLGDGVQLNAQDDYECGRTEHLLRFQGCLDRLTQG